MNIPNTITTIRLIIALVNYYCIIQYNWQWAFVLSLIVMIGDFLDGWSARYFGQTTVFGAWYDIASDRIVEIGYWIVFAYIGLISPAISIIFLVRGILVDGIRSFASQLGYTAFGDNSMMQSPLGILLVSSRFSRFSYAFLKMLAFAILCLAINYTNFHNFANILAILSTVFCIIRGLPVLLQSGQIMKNLDQQD